MVRCNGRLKKPALNLCIVTMIGLSIAAKGGGLAAYVADSNEALRFRLIRTSQDLKKVIENDGKEDETGQSWSQFAPEMTHQIYGEQ